ncbi:hypothetical protein RMCBS344292_18261 [Rhizopus microsporus]|nr:hypothetical protein RMCBS344292_18261 [Rhizopus microsporus]
MNNSWQTFRGLSLLCIYLIFLCLLKGTYTQTVSNHGFDKLPSKFFYFKDSEVVLWLDANSHTLYRSENQGKEWNQVEDIGKTATYLYEHPYDNDRAYVLSSGTTHWKTVDKGKTWQEFHTRSEPGSSSSHLSFHAERSGYILFSGVSCKFGSWLGIDCQTSVSCSYFWLNNN